MVAMFEIACLIALTVFTVWWFRRTSLYRNRTRSVIDQAQDTRQSRGSSMNGVYGGADGGGKQGGSALVDAAAGNAVQIVLLGIRILVVSDVARLRAIVAILVVR